MSEADSRWYLAQLKPNGLERAKLNLARQGFEPFAPYRDRVKRVGSRLRQVRDPLFPGYVFVRFDPRTTQWRKINATYGVSRLVSLRGNAPTAVPDGVVEALVARSEADGRLADAPLFDPGDDVRVISGPFEDFLGTVDHLNGMERVTVLLDMMNQSVRTTFHPADLEKIRRGTE